MTLSYLIGRRNAHVSPWTGERDALLTQLWAEGYSASEIASQIVDVAVSRMAVIGRVHRLKLPPRQARKRDVRPDTRRPRQFVPKPPAPPPRPELPPPPNEPKMRRLKLVDLKPTSCRWPIGDGRPQWLFCGADKMEGGVYCPFHQRMARVREKGK